jgi:lysophospholipase L1-like esterase
VLLPIYCANPNIEMLDEKVQTIKALIREIAAGYANVQVIDADDMVPHFADYYMEDMVHPNALGMELYGQNLAKAIKKIKF